MNNCGRIIAVDTNPKKFDIAIKLGGKLEDGKDRVECVNPLDDKYKLMNVRSKQSLLKHF